MGKTTTTGDVVKNFIASHPGMSARSMAAELLKQYPGLFSNYEQARSAVRRYVGKSGARHQSTGTQVNPDEVSAWEETVDRAVETFVAPNNLVTLEQALALCKADLNVWDVEKWLANRWGNQTQVKIWFRRKEHEPWENIRAEIDLRKSRAVRPKRKAGNGIGVAMLSDFHLGAYVGKLIKTPDFSYGIACAKLEAIAETINSWKYDEVVLFMLGDFIESFSGLNHLNSWKGLHKGAYGFSAIALAHDILSEHLYSKINNLTYVGFVSGNHDRVTASNEEDVYGEAAMAMHYIFNKDFKIESEWHPILLSKAFDGINYVCTHGHLGLSKKDTASLLFDYGRQGMYNVLAMGHLHTRGSRTKSQVRYEDNDIVVIDSRDYRAVRLPSLFTGNFYSESNGWNTNAGFMLFTNNGHGRPNAFDYSI